jgi:FSR family fosmidomycin resistance protein-like MFS transporter
MVPLYSGRSAGFSMSVFNTGGTLAFGVGPLFVTWYAQRYGLEALPLPCCSGLALAYIYFVVPAPPSEGMRRLGFLATIRESLGDAWRPISSSGW